nr:hypothetical protein [Tanacetum cinerariifolium]
MSRSEPGELASKSSQPVVILKFDIYIYTSTLTLEELNEAINEFSISLELRPRLPPLELTMNKLSDDVIGIYVEQLDQCGTMIPFSTFLLAVIRHFGIHVSQLVPMGVNRVTMFEIRCRSLNVSATVSLFQAFYKLCKQGHWFSFENKSGGRAKKCFKKITSSLKGWKRYFFFIDQRAILHAMPWRHIDTHFRDDFPISYNEWDADRIAERVIFLRKPPTPLLYMCRLTMDCRHPKLSHVIEYAKGNVITVDDFLSLPERNGTLDTISAAPINHSISKPLNTATGSKRKEAERQTASDQVEKIKKLEEDIFLKSKQLSNAESQVQLLVKEKEKLVAELARSELEHRSIIRDFIPQVVSWLQTSMEYRRSLGVPISLLYIVGWLGGLGLGWTKEQIAKILSSTSNLDIKGSKTWREKHKELFTLKCPYIQKVADSYLLSSGELMNVFPDVPVDATADNPGASTQYGKAGSSKSKPHETTPPNDDALA